MTVMTTEQGIPELIFVGGLAGFPGVERFALVEVPDSALFRLRSIDESDLEFVVVPPALLFPSYEPEIDDVSAERLGLRTADDALLLVVLTLPRDGGVPTANLLAPIVVNRRTRTAAQVVLDSGPHSLREPLPI